MQFDLVDLFNEYFEMFPADTPELKREVFILRHQVYCLETGFENQADCQVEFDQQGQAVYLEIDEYDDRAAHYLIRHRRTGKFAATVRLILPVAGNFEAPFPIEANSSLYEPVTDPSIRSTLAEISRFAVSKDFKRRRGETGTLAGVTDETVVYFEHDERRVLPHITVSLFAATFRMAIPHGITHVYAVMEPALLRLLNRFGIVFRHIGQDIDYHGLRRPCLGIGDEIMTGIREANPPLWDLITLRGTLRQPKNIHKNPDISQANIDRISS